MKAFVSYSHKDSWALDRLHTHLAMLRREGAITEWYDREILAGGNVDREIAGQLESCGLFLALVSPDFLNSDYCYEREMGRALERHETGELRVVPIIVEPCDWKSSPLKRLKALPRDGKPVTDWTNQNNAFVDVVTELRRILGESSSVQASEMAAPTAPPGSAGRRYRVKRDFDEIDRRDFCDQAFAIMRSYFESAVAELDGIEGLRGRFVPIGSHSFGCTVVNKQLDRGTAHITVHARQGSMGFGDIYYSFSENAPTNTANGGFSIEADEYDLFLHANLFAHSGNEERLTPEGAAERLWGLFLGQAGISDE